MLLSIFI